MIQTRTAVSIIMIISSLVIGFLFWLIYFKEPAQASFGWVEYLPYVNSTFNTIAASFIVLGIIFIKKGLKKQHGICRDTQFV